MLDHSTLDMQVVFNSRMDSLAIRLKTARTQRGLTQFELAQRAGMRQAEISKIENGEIARTTKLAQLAKALDCDPYWLATGEGQMWGQQADHDLEFDGRGGNVVGMEVRGASDFADHDVDIDPDDPSVRGVILGSGVHDGYALKVTGDANAPVLKAGQFIVIERNPAREGDLALFTLTNGRVVLRELVRETDDTYHVDSPGWSGRGTIPKADVRETEAVVAIVSSSRWKRIPG